MTQPSETPAEGSGTPSEADGKPLERPGRLEVVGLFVGIAAALAAVLVIGSARRVSAATGVFCLEKRMSS